MERKEGIIFPTRVQATKAHANDSESGRGRMESAKFREFHSALTIEIPCWRLPANKEIISRRFGRAVPG